MLRTFSKSFGRGGRYAVAVFAAALAVVTTVADAAAQTTMEKARARREQSPFQLYAGANLVLQANLVQCGLANTGNVCTDIFDSPTGGGGFWPAGTTNQYIFNSGLQIAGIIAGDAGFPWAGDTVGAYFFDARGTQQHGVSRSDIFDSLNPADVAVWPAAAFITDTTLFNPALEGARSISDQDTWVRYWDGDPNRLANRSHPMGIEVEQRSLSFNAPAGAENTIFFIYRFSNISNDPEFQQLNEAQFPGLSIPDGGYRIDDIYSAFAMDPDVTTHATSNFSTAILPFQLGVAYHAEFVTDDFNYSAMPSLYAPPFFQGPGFVGVKFLKSPVNATTGAEVGLTMFSNTFNPSSPVGLVDSEGVVQLWRYLSGEFNPAAGDVPCNVVAPRLCYLGQAAGDTRFYQASGPFSLDPGQSQVIVVAYTHAAPLTVAGYTPGTVLQPGIASATPGVGTTPIRTIERMAGWVSTPPAAVRPDGSVDESQVIVVRRSLLSNALVAQTIFNNKFLLPRPPEPPPFTLVPGDGQVSVIWEPSPTDTLGDPYYQIASDPSPTNPLFDPNYREFDVEGYRIYRATGLSGGFDLLAQFDKQGTTFVDVSCQLDPTFVPEEALPCTPATHDLSGTVVQFPEGSRIRDANTGGVVVLAADTVELGDTGIPFMFVDTDVRNGITYRYIVTAFDVNSLRSGPSLLESPRQPQLTVPRSRGANVTRPELQFALTGRDSVLNPSRGLPVLDNQGRFSGPMPPTPGLEGEFIEAVSAGLTPGVYGIRVDSAVPTQAIYETYYYLTNLKDNSTLTIPVIGRPDDPLTIELPPVTVPTDTARVRDQFVGQNMPLLAGGLFSTFTLEHWQWSSIMTDWAGTQPGFWPGAGNSPPAAGVDGGSRWFEGANETLPHPTLGMASGELSGVTIYNPQPFRNVANALYRRFHQSTFGLARAADIEVTWNGGAVESVHDVTHDVPVPFSTALRSSYGFFGDLDGDGELTYLDTRYMITSNIGGGVPDVGDWGAGATAPMVNQPVIGTVDFDADGTAEGSGFGMYINGQVYFFVGAAPASGVWTYRSYNGAVTMAVEDADTTYNFTNSFRNPAVPGLTLQVEVTQPATITNNSDLSRVHTVPDPYYVRSAFDVGPSNKALTFVNLPNEAVIRIFSVNGTLVRVLEHNDPQGGGTVFWDLRNRNNQFVASGVYFYVVEAPGGESRTGRFTVIQFAR